MRLGADRNTNDERGESEDREKVKRREDVAKEWVSAVEALKGRGRGFVHRAVCRKTSYR
jgi:hypothetical protein